MHFSCATAVLQSCYSLATVLVHSCYSRATVLATVSARLGWTTGWIQTQLGETGRCKNDPLELISGAMQATEAVVHLAIYQPLFHCDLILIQASGETNTKDLNLN